MKQVKSGAPASVPSARGNEPGGKDFPRIPEGSSCARFLEQFIHLDFSEDEARRHWEGILDNAQSLETSLGRPVGIHTAIVDYFTDKTQLLNSPLIVEINVFRQTERLAMVDPLTGLFNRRYMDVILRKELTRCERYGKEFSIALLDIDNFKTINDTKGHQFGDEVLRNLADLIRDSVREEDMVCRYGGEEFLIILPETDSEGAVILANRIRNALKADVFFQLHAITFSAGTASWPLSAQTLENLILAADTSLYQAKFSGKDRIVSAGAERRKFGRYQVSWDVKLYPENGPDPLEGIVAHNVSLGGIQFECPVRLPVDAEIQLVLTNPDEDNREVPATGVITWVKKKRGSYRYGIRFTSIPSALHESFHFQLADAAQKVM